MLTPWRLRVPPEQLEAWKSAAAAARVSTSAYVRGAVNAAVERDQAERRRAEDAEAERARQLAAMRGLG